MLTLARSARRRGSQRAIRAALRLGGVGLVQGFGGMRDFEGHISFDPRLPREWERMRFRLKVRGSRVQVDLTGEMLEITLVD